MKIKYWITIFILLVFPKTILAEGIEKYYINATLQSNGDLVVEEYFNLNGSYNGMERIIKFENTSLYDFNENLSSYGGSKIHNGSGLIINEVRAISIDSDFNFLEQTIKDSDLFKLKEYANKGDYGVYTIDDDYDGKSVRIFNPDKYNKAFYIKYTITNMGIIHKDIAELGWNIFGDELSESIESLVVYINIPNNKNELRIWGHGPYEGVTELISKEKAKLSIDHLSSYTAIDVRLTFDKDVLSKSTKKTNALALDKIIKYESDLAEQANYIREQEDITNIKYIDTYLYEMDERPSRSLYDLVESYINLLNDETEKKNYLNKLVTYQDKVDEYEYNSFKTILNEYSIISYDNYKYASNVINNVFSIELRSKMENELKSYHEMVIKKEKSRELTLTIISLSTLLVVVLIYYFKSQKYKLSFEYFRDFPSDLSPESVGLLVDLKVNKNEIAASILDLIRRKVITYEKKDNGSYDLIYEKKDYELSSQDKKIINLLFSTYKNNKSVYNTKKKRKIEYDDFEDWKDSVTANLKKYGYIEERSEKNKNIDSVLLVLGIIFTVSPLFIVGLTLLLIYAVRKYKSNVWIWLLIPLNIFLIIISLVFDKEINYSIIFSLIAIVTSKIMIKKIGAKLLIKRTSKGKEERQKWLALKRFLSEFSRIDERELPEVELWEKYLVYATALGIGKKVSKSMKLKIEEMKIDSSSLNTVVMINNMMDTTRFISSIDSISKSVVSSAKPPMEFSSGGSSWSSGSGGGGGFSGGSSGGGSFGGGGGGGRF